MYSIYALLTLPIILSGFAVFFSLRAKQAQRNPFGMLASPDEILRKNISPIKKTVPLAAKKTEEPTTPYNHDGIEHISTQMKKETTTKVDRIKTSANLQISDTEDTQADIEFDADLTAICPKCHRIVNRPLFTLDFSSGKPMLCRACPYCNTFLINDTETTIES